MNDGVRVDSDARDGSTLDLNTAQVRHLITALQAMLERQNPSEKPAKKKKKHTRRGFGYSYLSQQAQTVYQHMSRAGSISAREAMDDHGMTSAALTRRICDLEEAGYGILRVSKVHPITAKRYTRYSLTAQKPAS